jgi:phosphoglycolate phosphatase
MASIQFGTVSFDAGLVAFDKDGTLIDFEFMWGALAAAWIERLAGGADGAALRQELCRSIGYDPARGRTVPEGPLVVGANPQLQAIAASVLYRHGVPWTEADERARSAWRQVAAERPPADLVRAAGDVAGLLTRLQGAGVRVAVITTDDRAGTQEALRVLGIADHIDLLFCGNDPGVAWKPAPDALLAACAQLGVAPSRTAVVGDTTGDLLMGRRAGAGLCVGVLTGTGDRASLDGHADVVLHSIDEIRVGKQRNPNL